MLAMAIIALPETLTARLPVTTDPPTATTTRADLETPYQRFRMADTAFRIHSTLAMVVAVVVAAMAAPATRTIVGDASETMAECIPTRWQDAEAAVEAEALVEVGLTGDRV